MKLKRIAAYLLGCIALVSSFLVYMEYIHLLGFPDGLITELGYAERRIARIFVAVSVILSLYFTYLGRVAYRKEISKQLFAAIILYLIFIISIFLVDYYYRLYLIDSGGGKAQSNNSLNLTRN